MHVEILIYGPERQRKAIKKLLSNRKYPYEGPIRKGWNSPYICETEHVDIRLKAQCLPYLLQDIRNLGGGDMFIHHSFGKTMKIALWTWKKLSRWLPLKFVDMTDEKKTGIKMTTKDPEIPGCYIQMIGTLTDDKDDEGELL